MEDIIEMILNNPLIIIGANIPKPQKHKCTILYIHENDEKPFLKYSTGKKEKTISKAEFRESYQTLIQNGIFTKKWFNKHFPTKAGCNFTSIGGIFEKLGIAKHIKNGCYQLIQPQNN